MTLWPTVGCPNPLSTITVDSTMISSPYVVNPNSIASVGTNWADITVSNGTVPNTSHAALEVRGNATFQGEITIKGKNLSDMIMKIEERLAILHPNVELEEKWETLKSLGIAYRELEADILEKEKILSILKK